MRLRVQVVIEADDDDQQASAVHEVARIDREALSVDTLGLHLDESKNLLQKVQAVLIDEQVRTAWPSRWRVPTVADHELTKTQRSSSPARCSAPCT
jgi:hypothetical protein